MTWITLLRCRPAAKLTWRFGQMGMADVLPGNHAAGPPRAQIIADPGGIEAYLDFKPRAVTDEAGSGFFHVSSVVVTPLGETKVLGSTLPVRVKKSKVRPLLLSSLVSSPL